MVANQSDDEKNEPEPLSRRDREDLGKAARMMARVAKADADARAAELRADFEDQLASVYKSNDERWSELTAMADAGVAKLDEELRMRCLELGINEEYRPHLPLGWYGRGQNADTERRAELRAVAKSRLDAQAKAAKLEIEREAATFQMELLTASLPGVEARAWLAKIPTVEALMPPAFAR